MLPTLVPLTIPIWAIGQLLAKTWAISLLYGRKFLIVQHVDNNIGKFSPRYYPACGAASQISGVHSIIPVEENSRVEGQLRKKIDIKLLNKYRDVYPRDRI